MPNLTGDDRRESAVKVMGWKPYGRTAFGIVGMAKQVNRRLADSRHDVQESFTVEYRLHVSAQMVCYMAHAFLSVGTSCKVQQDNHRRGLWELCSMRPVCPAIGDGISLYLSGYGNQSLCLCYALEVCPCRTKGVGCLSPR